MGVGGGLGTDRKLMTDLVVSKQRNGEETTWKEVRHTSWTTIPLKMKASPFFEASKTTNQRYSATRRKTRIRRNLKSGNFTVHFIPRLYLRQGVVPLTRTEVHCSRTGEQARGIWRYTHCYGLSANINCPATVPQLLSPACSNSTATSSSGAVRRDITHICNLQLQDTWYRSTDFNSNN